MWGLKMIWLTVWIEINLAFVSGGIGTDFVFVLVVEIDSVLLWKIELDLVSV